MKEIISISNHRSENEKDIVYGRIADIEDFGLVTIIIISDTDSSILFFSVINDIRFCLFIDPSHSSTTLSKVNSKIKPVLLLLVLFVTIIHAGTGTGSIYLLWYKMYSRIRGGNNFAIAMMTYVASAPTMSWYGGTRVRSKHRS
jgi:uncharacterized membrane protein